MNGSPFNIEEWLLPSLGAPQTESEEFALWMVDKNVFTPVPSVKILNKLTPGIYKINDDSQCVPISVKSDELFRLKNSAIDGIVKDIDNFWNMVPKFKEFNLIPKRGILLEGPPGTGKTSVITLLCQQIIEKNGIIFNIGTVREFSRTVTFLQDIFRKIEPETPVITIIEDVDKIFSTIEPELLNFLDGKSSVSNHLIILTANNVENLSSAILRPSRVDKRYKLEYSDADERRDYFTRKNISEDVLESFVTETEGFSISQLKEVFISTQVLNHTLEDTIETLKKPIEKVNYLAEISSEISL